MELTGNNYQVTELGLIPNDWKVMPLEGLCKNKGLVRGPFGGALKKESFVRDGIKVYEQQNAIYRDINLGDYYIDSKKFDELRRFEVKPNDFIVSCSGTIGKIFLLPYYAPKGIINQALLKITIDDNVVSKYFFLHYFDWDKFQSKIIDNTQGGAMKNLVGMSVFRETKFAVPSVPEQAAIATALSDTNALIDNLEKLISKKRNIMKGTMQVLLTGRRRLFESKETWKRIRIGDTLKVRHGRSQKDVKSEDGNYPILGTGGIMGYSKEFLFDSESVLIGRKGTIDKPQYMNSPFWTVDTLFYTEIKKGYSAKFLYYKFLLIDWYSYNEASGVPSLNAKTIENIEIDIPCFETQLHIAQILSTMDDEIRSIEKRLNKYRMIKRGMMQALLTGQIRLS